MTCCQSVRRPFKGVSLSHGGVHIYQVAWPLPWSLGAEPKTKHCFEGTYIALILFVQPRHADMGKTMMGVNPKHEPRPQFVSLLVTSVGSLLDGDFVVMLKIPPMRSANFSVALRPPSIHNAQTFVNFQ